MKFKKSLLIGFFALIGSSYNVSALTLMSKDIAQATPLDNAQVFQGFGCKGDNISPELSWSNVPKGTKSFALMAYDPDAPTGSGWWHWQMVNISSEVNQIRGGAGDINKKIAPEGSRQLKNDYGVLGYGGACPPEGDGIHRYQFTLHALSVEHLDLPEDPSGALTGYMVNAHTIASATIEATYQR